MKVIGKWSRFGPSLHKKWEGVSKEMEKRHEKKPPLPDGTIAKEKPKTARVVAEDTDTDDERRGSIAHEAHEKERELKIARRVVRKWVRLAGIHTTKVGMVNEEEEFTVSWTHGIVPRLRGRIVIKH